MKTKNFFYSLMITLSTIGLLTALFLPLWSSTVTTPLSNTSVGYGLFPSFEELIKSLKLTGTDFVGIWASIVDIAAIFSIAFAIILTTISIAGMAKNINTSKLTKVFSFLLCVCFIVILVSSIVFVAINGFTSNILTISLNLNAGVFILLIATLLLSVFAFLQSKCKFHKTSKKRK